MITVTPISVYHEPGNSYQCLGSRGVGRSKIWVVFLIDGEPHHFRARLDRGLYPVTRDKAKALKATMPETLRVTESRCIVNTDDLQAWYAHAFPPKP